MKRIALLALLVCGMSLLVADTAEARRNSRRSGGGNYYSQPVRVAPTYTTRPVQTTQTYPVSYSTRPVTVQPASYSTTAARPVQATTTSYSTSTAQGVANIMASTGRVGHWGGNPGYEGCGMGATPAAAYAICCYGNSGMATVDVGYARGANGMWYCCRRYR